MNENRGHVRVITLNLWASEHDELRRLHVAAAEILQAAPDVVCLQEVGLLVDGRDAAEVLAQLTGLPVVATAGNRGRHEDGVAVLSSLVTRGAHQVALPRAGAKRDGHVAAVAELVSPSGRPLVAVSTHLAWGGDRVASRNAQIAALDRFLSELPAVSQPGAVTVLAGDFNCLPTSDTLRFLTGNHAFGEHGTFWVDAWDVAGDGAGFTSGPDNPAAARTALTCGITDTTLLPYRRIDYILVRGWVYGCPGFPLSAQLACTEGLFFGEAGTVHASDHWGLQASLWDPAL